MTSETTEVLTTVMSNVILGMIFVIVTRVVVLTLTAVRNRGKVTSAGIEPFRSWVGAIQWAGATMMLLGVLSPTDSLMVLWIFPGAIALGIAPELPQRIRELFEVGKDRKRAREIAA